MKTIYHATKFAVEGFSESLAYELLPHNIKVKIVEPGSTVTNFVAAVIYTAAIDETDQLRYMAGRDTELYFGIRQARLYPE